MIAPVPTHRPDPTGGVTAPANVTGAASDGAGPALLPEPSAGFGDSAITELAMLLTRADEQDRRAARTTAQVADQAALQGANDRAQRMSDKADADRNGALWSGLGDIASGACALVGAGVGDGAKPSTADLCCAPDAGRSFDWKDALGGLGRGATGTAAIGAGLWKADADGRDAQAAKAQALGDAAARHYDEARVEAQAADESIQKVQQFLQSTLEAENAARLAAVGGRA